MDENEAATRHQALVDGLKRDGLVRTLPVEGALRAVPRHLFLPGMALDVVYRDDAIVTKRADGQSISSSSQPAIMAIMLEQLALRPGLRVLEIGAGTGYNAALLAHLVGETGRVTTVDIDEDLVQRARAHLAAAGFDRVQVVCADGGLGYAPSAPYDRIILSVGAWDILPSWWEQLRPDGTLVLPLSVRGPQLSIAFEMTDSCLVSSSLFGCGFMPLRGAFAGASSTIQLETGLYLSMDDAATADGGLVSTLLHGTHTDMPTTVRVRTREVWSGLSLWLALHEPAYCSLIGEGATLEPSLGLPLTTGSPTTRSTVGLLDATALALLAAPPDAELLPARTSTDAFAVWIRSFGRDGGLAERLVGQVRAWDSAGRPTADRLRVRAYPQSHAYRPSADELVIDKRWTRLVFDWSR